MSVGKSGVAIGGGIVGGGGVTVGGGYGVHKATEETIGDHFKDDLLAESDKDDQWKKLEQKLKDKKDEEKSYELDTVTLKETLDGKELVKWCTKQKEKSYGSFLYRDHMYILKVKTYCIYTIRDKLKEETGKEVINTESGSTIETDFKASFDNLTKLNGTNANNGKVADEKSLNDIKTRYSEKEKGWKNLKDWCRWALDKSYKSDTDNLFKLTKHLCTKAKSA